MTSPTREHIIKIVRAGTRNRAFVGIVAPATLVLAGCGGSGVTSKPDHAALQQGMLKSGELAGMRTEGSSPIDNPAVWVANEQLLGSVATKESARLQRIGWISGLSEPLTTRGNSNTATTCA